MSGTEIKSEFFLLIELADMDRLGQGLPQPNYAQAKELYKKALALPGITPQHKKIALAALLEMEEKTRG